VEAARQPWRRILFNVRSCDVVALAFLRRVHAEDPADAATLRRADALALVSLACTTPCTRGFCVCCDAGPFLRGGSDVQLTDLGNRLLAETGTDTGRELIGAGEGLFAAAADADIRLREALEERALRSFGEQTCHLGSAMRRVSTGRVAQSLWEAMADHCFECGGCTFICPTCYCFSIRDRSDGDDWECCRLWDSCQYAAFTLEASGHNPREHHRDRVKRRFFHKASAQYYQRDGRANCVGCGRCVTVCLGDLSLPTGVTAIRRGAWHG
jgi:sulfhydrogenase subunit beta (sulfur reductase)